MMFKKKIKYVNYENINFNVQTYKLKVNRKKQGLLLGFVALCLVTPGTNWLIPVLGKGLNKFNPLFIYK